MDAAIIGAAPLSHCAGFAEERPQRLLTMSLIVVPSAAARARIEPTRLGASLNVTAVVGSAAATGRPIDWASSMYR